MFRFRHPFLKFLTNTLFTMAMFISIVGSGFAIWVFEQGL